VRGRIGSISGRLIGGDNQFLLDGDPHDSSATI
jgi:hypothetical protein